MGLSFCHLSRPDSRASPIPTSLDHKHEQMRIPALLHSGTQALQFGHSHHMLLGQSVQALGMGSYLSVSDASDLPPKFIHLTYSPPGGVIHKKLAIIGKGSMFRPLHPNLLIFHPVVEDLRQFFLTLSFTHKKPTFQRSAQSPTSSHNEFENSPTNWGFGSGALCVLQV